MLGRPALSPVQVDEHKTWITHETEAGPTLTEARRQSSRATALVSIDGQFLWSVLTWSHIALCLKDIPVRPEQLPKGWLREGGRRNLSLSTPAIRTPWWL